MRACDFDCFHRLQPSSVLDLFQDAAGRHAMELGSGYVHLAAKNQMWILSGVQYQILQQPCMYQTVRVFTWPLPVTSVTCRRDYRIEALDGTVLVKGTSDWAVMDGAKRRLVRAKEIYPENLTYCLTRSFEDKMPRLTDFEPTDSGITAVPGFSMLDMNGHVNNTKYANLILDAADLTREESIETFQIHYRKELLPHQPVTLWIQQSENALLVMGKDLQGNTMFHGRLVLA